MSFVHDLHAVILYCGAMFAMTRCQQADGMVVKSLEDCSAYDRKQESKGMQTVAVETGSATARSIGDGFFLLPRLRSADLPRPKALDRPTGYLRRLRR
jgi:hypothetical protein